ncbi:MAG: flagellar basal body P-ring protein FlgI, partial [bacterium]
MARKAVSIICVVLITTLSMSDIARSQPPEVPIKNVARVDGVRANQLQGYGVVTGLEGTGDGSIDFLNQTIANALSRMGINFKNQEQASQADLENIATVMVTATLPPFKKPGDKININVSSIGSAEDLTGGVLVQTPLKAGNGKVYAVAQGSLSKGGDAEDRHLTSVSVPNGAIVEREVPFEFTDDGRSLSLQLTRPDFKMADCIARNINAEYDRDLAKAESAGTVRVRIPSRFASNPVEFIAELKEIMIHPYKESKVVINERTGTVVMGGNIVISN